LFLELFDDPVDFFRNPRLFYFKNFVLIASFWASVWGCFLSARKSQPSSPDGSFARADTAGQNFLGWDFASS